MAAVGEKQMAIDTIDIERDEHIFEHYGMTRGQLMDRMGGSP